METIRNRAKDNFPMVLLTLLSIVQALALEFLWDHMRHRSELFNWSFAIIPAWMQIIATFSIIILIWLMYSGMLMRFRWTPSIGDSIFPFVVGLIQFFMIDIMGDKYFALWALVLGITFGAMVAINHNAMKRARRDDANIEFFRRFSPATIKDFVPQIVLVSTMLFLSVSLAVTSGNTGLKIFTLALIFVVVGIEANNARRYWNESMGQ